MLSHRVKALLFFLIAILFVESATLEFAKASEDKKPNILFVYLDDFGWKDTGYMGSDFYETPNLDRLAAQSMIFTNAYAGAANCAPSRACLLSGQYSPRHEIYNVGTGPRGQSSHRRLKHVPGVDTLDTSIKTWAQLLKDDGYATGTFGKWHLSDDPLPYGFDVNVGGTHSGSPPKGYYAPHPKAPGLEKAPKDEYLTNRISREANDFIKSNKDQPWLCYLTHFAVHSPVQANKSLIGKWESKAAGTLHSNAKMATMIQSVDDGVGMIMKTLDELQLTENTIVIFYSDNGGLGGATDMAPLKGYKGCYYEGGIRVPFFVRYPGITDQGLKSDEPVTAVDIFPTLCELAGVGLPADQPIDGMSIVPLVKSSTNTLDKADEPRSIYWHFPAYLQSYRGIRSEQRDPLFRTRPCSIVRKGDWKLHQYFESGDLELYNLKDDIGETTNLSESNSAKTKEMLDDLQAWQVKTNAPIPTTKNEKFDAEAEQAAIAKWNERQ